MEKGGWVRRVCVSSTEGLVLGLIIICMCDGLGGEEEKLRLPKFAIPKHYSLRLQPDLVHLKFNGSVEIEVEIIEKTDRLILNIAELDIHNISIYFHDKYKLLMPVKIVMDKNSERIMFEFGKELSIGIGILRMNFSGTVRDDMEGLFWRTYTINEEDKNMVATQFESIHARQCFPCWDEPDFKATFTLMLDVPSHLMALSNMPVLEEKINGFFKAVEFQKSPLMSTYLVAFVVGQFDHVEGHTSDGIKVRVYCPIGRGSEVVYALDVGIRALDFYKEYLSTPFALPKLDMIAIPNFPSGMENYGLVIFGEPLLLLDYQSCGVEMQQQVATYVAHELAHQWFGNLVTMEWWTDTWLNEGFATWLSYMAIDSLFPEWDVWFNFVTSSESALKEDNSAGSHPVVVKIDHLNEIDGFFDNIVYQKGSHILRMLNAYIGPKIFQHSLAVYLQKYAWSNTRTDDLWSVLEEVSGLPVNLVMNSWVTKKGFPYISVKANLQMLELAQSPSEASYEDQQWIVPIRLCCGNYETCHDIVLEKKNELFDLTKLLGCSCIHQFGENETCPWTIINVNRTGFYRVIYQDSIVFGLQHGVESKQFLKQSPSYLNYPVIVLEALNFLSIPQILNLTGLPYKLDISWGGREVAWTWFKDKWEYLMQKYGPRAHMTGYFEAIVSTFASTEKAAEVKTFFAHRHLSPVDKQSLKQSINKIQMRAQWVADIQQETNLPSLVNKLTRGRC